MAAVEVEVSGNAMNVRTAAAVAGGRRSPPARSIYQAVLVALCRSALSLSIENEELSPSQFGLSVSTSLWSWSRG